MKAGTPDRRNPRLTSELLILSKFENHVTELKNMRCRNSRHVSELPTVGTPDPQGFGKLAVGLWSCIPDTSGMTRTVNPPSRSKCDTSELPTHARTPDRRNSRPTSELPTNQPENNNFIIARQIPNTSGIARPAKIGLLFCLSNTLRTHMGWLEHL